MTFAHLRAEDATLLSVQTDEAPLTIGALCFFEGAAMRDPGGRLALAAIQAHVESRLDRLPRFRQRLQPVPLGPGPPVWVDDEDFDITWHVRAAALDAPGSDEQLRRLISELLAEPLDDRRPLWQIWIVSGLEDGRVAVLPKASHVMADGIALLELAAAVLDLDPEVEPVTPRPWHPSAAPNSLALAADTWIERGRRGVRAASAVGHALVHPTDALSTGRALVGLLRSVSTTAPRLPLTQPVGGKRDFLWFDLPLDDVRAVEHACEVTLNDVVLAFVAGALRRYSDRIDAGLDRRPARVLVPVSMHTGAGDGQVAQAQTENRFSILLTDLPTDVGDPAERLRRIHADMMRHKGADEARMASVVFGISDVVPTWLLATLATPVLQHQPFVNLAVTNLPGSPVPLYFADSRLLGLYPFIGVTGNVGTIIGVLSYTDHLGVGITVDADAVPDADALRADLEQSAAELLAIAPGRTGDRSGAARSQATR